MNLTKKQLVECAKMLGLKRAGTKATLKRRIAETMARHVTIERVSTNGTPPEERNTVWNPYRDGVTKSFLELWMRCREQARLAYVEGWSSLYASEAIEFGSMFHHLMETSPHHPEDIDKEARRYTKKFAKTPEGALFIDTEEASKIYGLAKVTYNEYCNWVDELEEDSDLEWILREKTFKIPFEVPGFPTAYLAGKLDGAYCNIPKKQNLVLEEYKTKARPSVQDSVDALLFDPQTQLYSIALKHMTGRTPDGIRYCLIRRTDLRGLKGEHLAEFFNRVAKDIQDGADPYNDKRKPYFYRIFHAVDDSDLRRMENWLRAVMADVLEWYDHVTAEEVPLRAPCYYENPFELVGKYGRSPFFRLMVEGHDSTMYQRETAHPELEEEN